MRKLQSLVVIGAISLVGACNDSGTSEDTQNTVVIAPPQSEKTVLISSSDVMNKSYWLGAEDRISEAGSDTEDKTLTFGDRSLSGFAVFSTPEFAIGDQKTLMLNIDYLPSDAAESASIIRLSFEGEKTNLVDLSVDSSSYMVSRGELSGVTVDLQAAPLMNSLKTVVQIPAGSTKASVSILPAAGSTLGMYEKSAVGYFGLRNLEVTTE